MVAFDSTISLGNILTALGTVGGLLWAYHQWDKKVEIRHVENKAQTLVLNNDIKRLETKVDHTNGQLGSTQTQINQLVTLTSTHIAEDKVFHDDIERRISRQENRS